ncbi:MAG: hypothetical protein KJO22_06615 [Bacteroidia bacterium]|nr:hypothetical protein [Winogradskyella sp.]MBT8376523.1 hypothetical protein [Bacteroidia bacterium]
MDELDLLKKDWNKDKAEYKNFSDKDLYPMLHRKSSSIVKTLFYISIAELIFWILINTIPYFLSDDYKAKLDSIYDNDVFMVSLTVLSYLIIILFIYLLYKSHKAISVIDDAKTLMRKILNTRKVIKWYVIYNLVMAFVSMIIGTFYGINHDPEFSSHVASFSRMQMFSFSAFMVIFIGIFVLIIWLFYRLLYGILLKRLNKNYNELRKLEV